MLGVGGTCLLSLMDGFEELDFEDELPMVRYLSRTRTRRMADYEEGRV